MARCGRRGEQGQKKISGLEVACGQSLPALDDTVDLAFVQIWVFLANTGPARTDEWMPTIGDRCPYSRRSTLP